MRVKIGNEWHEVAKGKPIMVQFTEGDLHNVRNMAPGATMYACAEDDEFATADDFRAWMAEGAA